MKDYVSKTIEEFPKKIISVASSLATENLYRVWEDQHAKKLDEVQASAFHHTVAQLLFMSSRARRDIQTAVAFLTTRVKSPDKVKTGAEISKWHKEFGTHTVS